LAYHHCHYHKNGFLHAPHPTPPATPAQGL